MAALPPIQSLQALEAIDRLGSAHRAAETLSITAPAISHRLRALEAMLGAPVVAAQGRGLTLTPRGKALVAEIRPILAALKQAVAPPTAAASGPLRIAAAPGFASAWLCPRLGEFSAVAPDIALSLATASDDETDIEIAFEAPSSANEADFLTQPVFFPVCAPALAQSPPRPGALPQAPLLHLFDRRDWLNWAHQANASLAQDDEVIFEDANLLLAAAIAGQGVALGDDITCGRYLAEGALIRPHRATSKSGRAYFLKIARETPAALAFANWLRDAIAA